MNSNLYSIIVKKMLVLSVCSAPMLAAEWGPWHPIMVAYPNLEARVIRKNFNESAKKWEWNYQIRNGYAQWVGITIKVRGEGGVESRFVIASGQTVDAGFVLTTEGGDTLNLTPLKFCFADNESDAMFCSKQGETADGLGSPSESASDRTSRSAARETERKHQEEKRIEHEQEKARKQEEATKQEETKQREAAHRRQEDEARGKDEDARRRERSEARGRALEEERLAQKRAEDERVIMMGGSLAMAGVTVDPGPGLVAGDFIIGVGSGSFSNGGDDNAVSPQRPDISLNGTLSGLMQLRFYSWFGDQQPLNSRMEWRLQTRVLNLNSGTSVIDGTSRSASLVSYGAGATYWYKAIGLVAQFQSTKLNLETHKAINPVTMGVYSASKDLSGLRYGIALGSTREKRDYLELGVLMGQGSQSFYFQGALGWGFVRVEQERVSLSTPLYSQEDPNVQLVKDSVNGFGIQLGLRIAW